MMMATTFSLPPMFLALTWVITSPRDGRDVGSSSTELLCFCGCSLPYVLGSRGHGRTSACPQPCTCASFLDYRQSQLILGESIFLYHPHDLLFLCCRQSVLVSHVFSLLSLCPSPLSTALTKVMLSAG